MPKRKTPPRAKDGFGGIDWDKQLRWSVEWCKQRLLEDGSVPAIFTVYSRDNAIPVMTDMADKRKVRALVGLLCYAYDAIGVLFLAEAWMAMADKKPDESDDAFRTRAEEHPPSERDDRVEVLVVTATYYGADGKRTGKQLMREIDRDWTTGKPIGLKEIELLPGVSADSAGGEITGPTFEILPEVRGGPKTREDARRALDLVESLGIIERHKLPPLPN